MILVPARASQAALFLALGGSSSVGAVDPLPLGNQPHHRSLRLAGGTFGKSDTSRGITGAPERTAAGAPAPKVGNRIVLVVNVVSSEDITTDYSNAELADRIFGSFLGGSLADQVDLASQYSACSHSQLDFFPQPDSISFNDAVSDIVDGVATVYSTKPIDADPWRMIDDVEEKLESAHGDRKADHVMFCLPEGVLKKGKTSWGIEDGNPKGYVTAYNHKRCGFVGTVMHEIGHNLGMSHASEGEGENYKEYGDGSGFMGSGGGPRECFSTPNTYKLGWFADRHVVLTAGTGFSGRLYGFTRYAATDPSDKMIVRINDPACEECDWYIAFNHKDGFNNRTGEGGNRVMLHTKGGPVRKYMDAFVQARLAAESSYTAVVNGKDMEVNVGQINTAEGWAQVTVVPKEGLCEELGPIVGDEVCKSVSNQCEATADLAENDNESCMEWCARSGLVCTGAWNDGAFCEKKNEIGCWKRGKGASICRCEVGLCQSFLDPVHLIVDDEICSDTPNKCVANAALEANDNESCDEWCQRQGSTCTGAWDNGDFCEKLNPISCGLPGNKHSICQCEAGLCQSFLAPFDLIGEGEICSDTPNECVAKADLEHNNIESCDKWCQQQGLMCTEAWNDAWDNADSCEKLDTINCKDTGNKLSICQCEDVGLCQKFLVPVDLINGNEVCSGTPNECVATALLEANDRESCDEWCQRQGLTCTGAWDDGDFCEKLGMIECSDTGNERSICRCEEQ